MNDRREAPLPQLAAAAHLPQASHWSSRSASTSARSWYRRARADPETPGPEGGPGQPEDDQDKETMIMATAASAAEAAPQTAKPRKRKRVFMWTFLAIQALFVIWILGAVLSGT